MHLQLSQTGWVAATLLVLGPLLSDAHMVLKDPAPFNDATTAPIKLADFPCQGKPTKDSASATVKAGEDLKVTLENPVCHGGGSCQFSLSYNDMDSFIVIESVMGGCTVQGDGTTGACQYDFSVPIPSEAPSGKTIFAWTWASRVTSEFYMTCAYIEIESGGDGFTAPALFEANMGGDTCSTGYQDAAIYPKPGNVLILGGDYKGGVTGKATSECTTTQNTKMLTVDKDGNQKEGSDGTELTSKTATWDGGSGKVVTMDGAKDSDGDNDFSNGTPSDSDSSSAGASSSGVASSGSGSSSSSGSGNSSNSDSSGSGSSTNESASTQNQASSNDSSNNSDTDSQTSSNDGVSGSSSNDGSGSGSTDDGSTQSASDSSGSTSSSGSDTCKSSSKGGWFFKDQSSRRRRRKRSVQQTQKRWLHFFR